MSPLRALRAVKRATPRALWQHTGRPVPLRWAALLVALALAIGAVVPTLAQQWVGAGHRMPKAPPDWAVAPATPKPGCIYFPETQHNLCGGFRQYWETYGGLLMFGYPLTEEYFAPELGHPGHDGVVTQWFERARFEWHPGEIPQRFDVLQGHLGREILAMLTAPKPTPTATPTPTPTPTATPTPTPTPTATPTPTPTPTATPTPTPTPTYLLTITPQSDTRVLGKDPDGSGPLSANQRRVIAKLTLAGSPVVGQNILFSVTAQSGATSVTPTGVQTVATNSSGEATVDYTFTDNGTPGGYFTITACADIKAPFGACYDEPVATTVTYFVPATASITPTSIPEAQAGATNTGVDAIVSVSFPTPNEVHPLAALKVVLLIDDGNGPWNSGTTANGSFAACNNTDGTDTKAGTVTTASSFDAQLWACHYNNDGSSDTVTVRAYWDVNGNGTVDLTEPELNSSPVALTITDS